MGILLLFFSLTFLNKVLKIIFNNILKFEKRANNNSFLYNNPLHLHLYEKIIEDCLYLKYNKRFSFYFYIIYIIFKYTTIIKMIYIYIFYFYYTLKILYI